MSQKHLGKRHLHWMPVSPLVDIDAVAAQAGYSTVSRWASDYFCQRAGRRDLVIGPDLDLPLSAMPVPLISRRNRAGKARTCGARIPAAIDMKAMATRAGYSSVARFTSDVVHFLAGRPELMVGPDQPVREDFFTGERGNQLNLTA